MTSHEKAVNALNVRIERLQANLRETKDESAQRFLVQSVVVTLGAAEALNEYIKQVGEYAKRRYSALKQMNETFAAQHAALLGTGREQLEKLKANPTDRTLRKEIERTQKEMEAVQKNTRRTANALQRDLAPSLATIDQMADHIRKLSEATQNDALKRQLKSMVRQVRELYADQPDLPAKGIVDVATWEKSAAAEIDQAAGFHDAYARAGYQAALALEWMILGVSANPPSTTEEAVQRANEAVSARLKEITARFATP